MKFKDHDTWIVSPKLFVAVDQGFSKAPVPDDLRPHFHGIAIVTHTHMPEDRLALMKNGILVQVVEIEWEKPMEKES